MHNNLYNVLPVGMYKKNCPTFHNGGQITIIITEIIKVKIKTIKLII